MILFRLDVIRDFVLVPIHNIQFLGAGTIRLGYAYSLDSEVVLLIHHVQTSISSTSWLRIDWVQRHSVLLYILLLLFIYSILSLDQSCSSFLVWVQIIGHWLILSGDVRSIEDWFWYSCSLIVIIGFFRAVDIEGHIHLNLAFFNSIHHSFQGSHLPFIFFILWASAKGCEVVPCQNLGVLELLLQFSVHRVRLLLLVDHFLLLLWFICHRLVVRFHWVGVFKLSILEDLLWTCSNLNAISTLRIWLRNRPLLEWTAVCRHHWFHVQGRFLRGSFAIWLEDVIAL